MIEPFQKIIERGDDLQLAITQLLGLEKPFPQVLVERAMIDDVFARLLYTASVEQTLIPSILSIADNEVPTAETQNHSTNELLKRGAKSLVKWGLSGFATAPQELIKTRLSICEACPNLTEATGKFVYKIKLSKTENTAICSLCGCVVSRKTTLPGEKCPANKW